MNAEEDFDKGVFAVLIALGGVAVTLSAMFWFVEEPARKGLQPPDPFEPVCESRDPEPAPTPADWVQPTREGDAFELYCGGLPSGTFGCAPEECRAGFSHADLRVRAAVRFEICRAPMDPSLIEAVIHIESRGNVGAISEAGARGLMQVMPGTAREVAAWIDLDYYDGMEFDPGLNVRLGTAYLDYLLRRYANDTPAALTAYHRGPRNTDAILQKYGILPDFILDAYANPVQAKRKDIQATKEEQQ